MDELLKFSPKGYFVDVPSWYETVDFIAKNHYTGSVRFARLTVGLFNEDEELCGVIMYASPAQAATIPCYLGIEQKYGVELSRLILKEGLGRNSASWFISQANKFLKLEMPFIKGIVTYADPFTLTDCIGNVTKTGHLGHVYQATNATYLGKTTPKYILVDKSGVVFNQRGLSKITCPKQGRGVERHVRKVLGIARRKETVDVKVWLNDSITEAISNGTLRKIKHPGLHVYGYDLGGVTFKQSLPYPK